MGPTLLFFSLCILNCILLISSLHRYVALGQRSTNDYSYIGDDFPLTAPIPGGSLPDIIYSFEESVRFEVNNTSVDVWYGNLARQFGYLRLGPERRIFAVSMHHQQHCLYFFALSLAKKRRHDEHTKHCLNYLRQNILCQADTTLEPPNWMDRAMEGIKTGDVRNCRDWTESYRFVEDNYWDWMSYRKEKLKEKENL